jgi:hypothetical protein
MEENSRTAVYHRTIERRAMWELERLAQLKAMVEAGLLTEEEAQERS